MTVKKLTPQTVRTEGEAAQLERDNASKDGWWIVAGTETVTIAKQRSGESLTESVTIPKDVLDEFIKFYIEG